MDATSLASGAREKGNAVAQLRERPPLNMLPACLATHRTSRRLPVNDDAVAAESAAVLCPFALPASPRGDHVSLDLGVLGLAHQGDQLRIALAQFDDQHPIAVDGASRGGCRLRCRRNRYCVTPVLAVRPNRVAGGSALGSERVREARHRPPRPEPPSKLTRRGLSFLPIERVGTSVPP